NGQACNLLLATKNALLVETLIPNADKPVAFSLSSGSKQLFTPAVLVTEEQGRPLVSRLIPESITLDTDTNGVAKPKSVSFVLLGSEFRQLEPAAVSLRTGKTTGPATVETSGDSMIIT